MAEKTLTTSDYAKMQVAGETVCAVNTWSDAARQAAIQARKSKYTELVANRTYAFQKGSRAFRTNSSADHKFAADAHDKAAGMARDGKVMAERNQEPSHAQDFAKMQKEHEAHRDSHMRHAKRITHN